MKSLSYVLKKSGHDIYENITVVLIVSLLSFIPAIPGIFLKLSPITVGYLTITVIPSLVAGFYAMSIKINRKPFKYKYFFEGLKKYFLKGVIFGLYVAIFIFILWASWWYYLKVKTVASFVVAIFQTYFFIMIALSQTYTIPLMVLENKKISDCIKTSFKLFLDNGTYTCGSFIQVVTVSALLLITVVSMPLLFSGMYSILLINLYNNLLLKYCDEKE